MTITHDALANLVCRLTDGDGIHATAYPRLRLIRASRPSEPIHTVYGPTLCLIAQGRKQLVLGSEIHEYGPDRTLVASVDVPVIGTVTEASPDAPYLCFCLDLDPGVLSDVALDKTRALTAANGAARGVSFDRVQRDLVVAAERLVALLASPQDLGALGPLAEKELLYRLTQGAHAPHLLQFADGQSTLQRISRAIGLIKRDFRRPLRIEQLAEAATMSPATLHRHFKAVTAMSPLQYQKRLRLQEARRLILMQPMDAAAAAFVVGYESPSQFSREYSRLFGAPPKRDASRLRTESSLGERLATASFEAGAASRAGTAPV